MPACSTAFPSRTFTQPRTFIQRGVRTGGRDEALPRNGKPDGEAAAPSRAVAFRADGAAVTAHQPPHEGQADAQTAGS